VRWPARQFVDRNILDQFLGKRQSANEPSLTDREIEVLQLIVQGHIKKEIATKLLLSAHTVDSHVRNIDQKLHVNNRAGAVAAAMRQGLV